MTPRPLFPMHRPQDAVQCLWGALRALAAAGRQEARRQRHLKAGLSCRGWGEARPQGWAQDISTDKGETQGYAFVVMPHTSLHHVGTMARSVSVCCDALPQGRVWHGELCREFLSFSHALPVTGGRTKITAFAL